MPLILGTNSIKDTGYDVANSLRFDRGSSDYLNRIPSSAGDTKKASFSCWFKISELAATRSSAYQIFHSVYDGTNRWLISIDDSDQLFVGHYNGSGWDLLLISSQKIRDMSAFYNLIVIIDTSQSTSSNRVKIYLNGSQVTSFGTETYPSLNFNGIWCKNSTTEIGRYAVSSSQYGSFYLAESVCLDGTVASTTDFGEFDSDSPTIWKPKDVSGLTFGTNGFYLDFENASSLGADVSGNSNNFTVNNLTSVDQSTDTCTNNFCTWNPLIVRIGRTQPTFSEGNLKCQHNDTGGPTPSWGTFLLNSGKWYWEVKITSAGIHYCGVWQPGYNNGDVSDALDGIVIYRQDGNKQAETAATTTSYGDSFTTGDIIGVAVDVDTGTIWFSKNGTWQNSATISEIGAGTTTNSAYTGKSFSTNGILPSVSSYQHNGNAIVEANFGGGTSFSISSGNADANGFGNFEYPVPSGYFSLCSKNLAEFG